MFCINCGDELKVGARFCANCGQRVREGTELIPTTTSSLPTPSQRRYSQSRRDPLDFIDGDDVEVPFKDVFGSGLESETDKLREEAERYYLHFQCDERPSDFQKVFKFCKRALAIDPNDATFYIILADAFIYADRFQDAEIAYNNAIALGHMSMASYNIKAYALVQTAMIAFKVKRIEEARSLYAKAAALTPDLVRSFFLDTMYYGYEINAGRRSPFAILKEYQRFIEYNKSEEKAERLRQLYPHKGAS